MLNSGYLTKGNQVMADLAVLQQTLGVSFNDISLLEQALVHRTYINQNPGFAPTYNERLEFIGDAVLGLIVAEKLYRDYPHFDEGEMTKLRSALVRRETLAQMLLRAGETDQFAEALAGTNERDVLQRRLQLKTLLFGMGETFRTLLLSK